MNRIEQLAFVGITCGLVASAQAEVVYDNLITPLNQYAGASSIPYLEVADDFTLAGTSRLFESLTVAYAGFNFDGDETMTVSIYKMDGAPTAGSFGFNTPGTVLFTTTVPITETTGSTLTFTDPKVGFLPNTIAVGFSFTGLAPSGDAGPLLFNPPSPGTSFYDFWLRGFPNAGDPWGLFSINNGNPPINLGLKITATTPEGGDWLNLCGVATILGLGLIRQFRGQSLAAA